MFTALSIGLWIYRSIATPLVKLKKATQNIKEGNLDFVLEVDGDDEFSELCRDFEEMRKRLKESAEEKVLMDKENKELISNISHDLKTPITAVKGYVEGIMDGVADTPEKIDRYVKTIYNKTNGMPSAKMAGLMAAAIVSDTVMFKSPTCTQRDIDIANRMSRIANVSLEELGQTIFSAATGEDKSAESIIRTDYKEFHIGGHNLAVSQITCLDSDRLMARKEEFLATMETIRKKNGLDIVLLMITNVLVEGSYLLYSGDTETIRQAFNITGEEKNCVFLSKIMSRKKQIIPSLSALWG